MKHPHVHLYFFAAICLTFMGCSDNSSKPAGSAETKQKITILSWEEYFPEETLHQFTEQTGIEIEYRAYDNTDELEGLLSSNPDQIDIVITDDHTAAGLMKTKMFAELNKSLLPNLTNLDPTYQDLWFDPGNQYSVPYLWGSTLLVYNEDLVGEIEDPSWSLLWDKERIGEQKIYMIDEIYDYFAVALMKSGQSFNQPDDNGITQAAAALEQQARTMNVSYTDFGAISDDLVSGECAAALLYSSEALSAVDANEDLCAVIPKEGAVLWIDNLLISKESANKGAAHQFIDYILDPEVGAECANFNWLATPNKQSKALLDDELLEDPAIYPAVEVLERCDFLSREKLQSAQEVYRNLHGLRQILNQQES